MELKKIFSFDDISNISLSIPISVNENNFFNDVVKSLEVENFKTTKSYKTNITKFLDNVMPQITFNGKGFGFGLTKTKIASQFIEPSEFAPVGDEGLNLKGFSTSEVFTKENLSDISSDFNYILGLISGKLGLDNKNYEVNFIIRLTKDGYFTKTLDYLLKPESKLLFGNVNDLHLQGFKIIVDEKIFNNTSQTTYRINEELDDIEDKNTCNISATFKFKYSGPIDYFKFISEGIDRLNNLSMTIIGDINESR